MSPCSPVCAEVGLGFVYVFHECVMGFAVLLYRVLEGTFIGIWGVPLRV